MDQIEDFLRRMSQLQLGDLRDWDWRPFLAVIGVSFFASSVIALMYSVFFERRTSGSDVHRSFPVLGASIAVIFICLQASLPLSLGLLGALSIVRFRMPIKEPEEIGFLMLLIASSICCATLNFMLLALLVATTAIVLTIMRALPWVFGRRTSVGSIVVTAQEEEFDRAFGKVKALVSAHSKSAKLDAVTNYEGNSSATFTLFRGSGDRLTTLQNELRKVVEGGEVNLFFQRPLSL